MRRGRCLVCQRWQDQAICGACLAMFAPQVTRCRRCALALASPSSGVPSADAEQDSIGALVCADCRARPPRFESALALADYGFPWNRLVARLKFEQQPELARVLGPLLAAVVARSDHRPADLVVPVPLAPARLAERGYNQAWQLARALVPVLGMTARADLLERWRDTAHQVGASRGQRQHHLADSMWVDPRHAQHLRGRHVALVDDVLTTGGTAQAASSALLDAGAAGVQVWVLARTPAPGSAP